MFIREGSASTLPTLPQSIGTQVSWDPSTISNIVFGTIMVFVSIVAIWQGRHRRLVAIDEELAIITSRRRSISPLNCFHIRPDAATQLPAPQLMLHDGSTASSSTAQLDLADRERNQNGLPVATHNAFIPTISNRVTTVSTMGSV